MYPSCQFFYKRENYYNIKQTHRALFDSQRVKDFVNNIGTQQYKGTNVICLMILWSDGYDPNTSTKGNRKGAWVATWTFVMYDMAEQCVYNVLTTLCAVGPGKGDDQEDHTLVFQLMVVDNMKLYNVDGNNKPITVISRFHNMTEINIFVTTIAILMDNPERRSNYGLLQGNSKNHGIFGTSCNFELLHLPFEACNVCKQNYINYVIIGDWESPLHNFQCDHCYGYSLQRLLRNGIYNTPLATLPDANDAPSISLAGGLGIITTQLLKLGW